MLLSVLDTLVRSWMHAFGGIMIAFGHGVDFVLWHKYGVSQLA